MWCCYYHFYYHQYYYYYCAAAFVNTDDINKECKLTASIIITIITTNAVISSSASTFITILPLLLHPLIHLTYILLTRLCSLMYINRVGHNTFSLQVPVFVVGTKLDLMGTYRSYNRSRSSTIAEECSADEINVVSRRREIREIEITRNGEFRRLQ